MADTGGLPELLDAARRRWPLIALVAIGVVAGATAYVESLPAQYDGRAVVTFSPRPKTEASADTVRLLAPKYVAYVTSPSTVRSVAATVGLDPADLADAIDASVAPDTGNMEVEVRLPSPEDAAAAANALATEAVRFSTNDRLLFGELVVYAVTPSAPAAPPRRLLEAAAGVVGVLLGVAVAFVIERGRPRVRTWRDVARLSGCRILGRIPVSRTLRRRPTEAFSDPAVGAAARTLRANLEREWQEGRVDVLVVTSPNAGDGKTAVATLLTEALARLGAEVLLVDADARRPGVARMLGLQNAGGLSDVLREKATLTEAVQPGWTEGISVLATARDPEMGDLLARRFSAVVQEARLKFDLVVVDAPPLLGTDEARTLATMTNAVLLVVRAGSAAAPVNEAMLSLETLKARVLGIVVNRSRESKSGYY